MFVVGSSYTRAEIAARLGGSEQVYLPTVRNRVVCGCFKPETNPAAPRIVLPGKGPRREKTARLLAEQGGSIPVFLTRAVNDWVYQGMFEVERWSREPEDVLTHRGSRADVTSVLWLRNVS